MPEQRTVRVGILCAGTTLPHWQAQVVRHLIEVSGAELVVVGSPRQDQLLELKRTGPFYAQLHKKCLDLVTSTALVPVDLSDPLALLPSVELVRTSTGELDLAPLSDYSPDVVISLLAENDPAKGPSEFPASVWNFTIGGARLFPNGSPGIQGKFITDTSIEVQLSAAGHGQIRSQLPLRNEQDDPTLDPVLLGASWLPALVVAAMRAGRSGLIELNSINKVKSADDQITITSLLWAWAKLRIRQFGREKEVLRAVPEWNIGILYQPISALIQEDPSMNVRWLPSPSVGNMRMEPFGFTAPDGQLNVLYRKNHRNSENDEIARLRPKSDSVLKRSRTMLTAAASLHYPFVVERPEGAFALISYPHQDRLELFRVADTNDKLDHVKTLMERALINPTVINFEERWWLFGTDPDAPDSVLLAFYADTLEGPYHPHALNPLKFSTVSTRPAGTPFVHAGVLWRPARDVSVEGTHQVTFNRIDKLTPHEFEEETVTHLGGFPGTVYGKGIRTVCAMGDITLIDGLRGTSSPAKSNSGERRSKSSKSNKRKKE